MCSGMELFLTLNGAIRSRRDSSTFVVRIMWFKYSSIAMASLYYTVYYIFTQINTVVYISRNI
jgi:hypothetical protein